MKKIAIQLFCIFCLNLFLSSSFSATPPNAQIDCTGDGISGYQFGIDQLPIDVTSAFWILGDGHFRTGLNITHHMKVGNSVVQTYLLRPYRPSPPTKLISGGCTDGNTSSQPNFHVAMGPSQSVKVGTSWNPISGQKHYTILTFENVNGNDTGVVKINFQNNVQSLDVNINENNTTWYSNLNVDNVDKEIEFKFGNLNPGEQRHLLIETFVIPYPSSTHLNYNVTMATTKGDIFYNSNQSTEIKRYPHDPNNKEVSDTLICPNNPDKTNLEYRIDFQNIGQDFANTVRIEDYLPNFLEYTNFQYISSSDPCQVIRNGNYIEFTFNDIELPGLDQVFPYIPHPNETKGHVIFSIYTEACLEETVIDNIADIYFDGLAPISTTIATTNVIYSDVCWGMDTCDGDTGGDDDDGGTGEDGPPPMGFINTNPGFEVYPNPFTDLVIYRVGVI